MAYYLRKSFKAGAIRLNLSKGGVGVSAGVRGARVGVASDGRVYTHAGRHGLYARNSVGRIGGGSGGRASGTKMPGGVVAIDADTGVTYGKVLAEPVPSFADSIRKPQSHVGSQAILVVFAGIVVGLIAAPYWTQEAGRIGIGVAAILVVLGIVLATRARRQSTAMNRFYSLLLDLAAHGRSLSDETLAAISSHATAKSLRPSDKDYVSKLGYLTAITQVARDRQVDDDELNLLAQLETSLGLPSDYTSQARLEVYRTEYFEAVADHELTDEEESTLEHIRRQLSIPDDSITEELGYLEELKELRRITSGDLPEVDAQLKLRRGEVCHYRGVGRLLKSKIQQSFQRDGQKYQVRGLEIDKEGDLLVTNQRLLLVHAGTTSIPIAKILDTEVDWDQKLVTIVKDGAVKPILLTTPDAALVGAIIDQL